MKKTTEIIFILLVGIILLSGCNDNYNIEKIDTCIIKDLLQVSAGGDWGTGNMCMYETTCGKVVSHVCSLNINEYICKYTYKKGYSDYNKRFFWKRCSLE